MGLTIEACSDGMLEEIGSAPQIDFWWSLCWRRTGELHALSSAKGLERSVDRRQRCVLRRHYEKLGCIVGAKDTASKAQLYYRRKYRTTIF